MNNITKTLILFMFLLAGCTSRTNIKSIQDSPRNYVDKEVSIEGEVTSTFSLAFINYFELDDGTGKIKVITTKPLPADSEHIIVRGTVQYYTLGTMRLLAVKEDDSD